MSLGVAAGALLLSAAIWLPRPAQVALAAIALLSSLLATLLAPDLLFARAPLSLFNGPYGHLLNFNGLTHTVLLALAARRERVPLRARGAPALGRAALTRAPCRGRTSARASAIVARMIEPAVADAIDFASVRRVLVIKLRHHGDVLLASPVFTALSPRGAARRDRRARLPRNRADAGGASGDREGARDRSQPQEPRPAGAGCRASSRSGGRCARVTTTSSSTSPIIRAARGSRALVGARHAVAPERTRNGWLWRRCFTHRYLLPRSTPRHTVEQNLDALRRIGLWPDDADKPLVFVPGPAAQARVDALLAAHGLARKRFILVHPGSRWMFKCWPAQPTAALLDRLADDGWRVVLTAAPDPAEAKLVAAIKASMRSHARSTSRDS